MKKICTIVGGVNGTGKTSMLGALKEIPPDMGIILTGADCGALADPGDQIDNCLKKGISFTQETTLSGFRTERTAKKALEAGYFVRLYYVGLNTAQESLDRIANRVKRGGHNIPADDVLRRFDGRWEAVAKVQ